MTKEHFSKEHALRLSSALLFAAAMYMLLSDFREHSQETQAWLCLYLPIVLPVEWFLLKPVVTGTLKKVRCEPIVKGKERESSGHFILSCGGRESMMELDELCVVQLADGRSISLMILPPGDRMQITFANKDHMTNIAWERRKTADESEPDQASIFMHLGIPKTRLESNGDSESVKGWPEIVFRANRTQLSIRDSRGQETSVRFHSDDVDERV